MFVIEKYSLIEIITVTFGGKMRSIIEQVEIMKGKMIGPSLNFKNLVSDDEKEKYYGVCIGCCPPILNQTQVFNHIKVNTVDRECVDGEGNMVVLNHEMFKCENCGDKDNEYKKCPHCGIKTYVRMVVTTLYVEITVGAGYVMKGYQMIIMVIMFIIDGTRDKSIFESL